MIGRRPAARARAVGIGLLAAVAGFVLLGAPRAEAYVRYKTMSGKSFFWPQTCVPIFAYPATMKDDNGGMQMTPAEIMNAATGAAAAWSADMNSCTFIRPNVTEHDEAAPKAGLDYTNALVFRVTSWCAPTDGPGMCSYASEALAITSVFVAKSDGRILDADIEVNAKNFVWTDLEANPSLVKDQDLQNALTHEMGHLVGLDHTCYSDGQFPIPTDNAGNEIPSCNNAPAAVQATTMFASANPGDTAKRTLEPDDVQGVCDIYPVAQNPNLCLAKDEPPPKAGCAVVATPSGRGGAGAAAFAAALVLVLARRRGRTRT